MSEGWKKGLLAAGWNPRRAVQLAVRIEEMGSELYRGLATRWESSPNLRGLFASLATDEVAHRERFRALLATAGGSREDPGALLDEECLMAIASTSFFSEESGALGEIARLTTEEQVLDKVFQFEKVTLLYYRGLRDVLGASPTLDAIIAEEKQHTIDVLHAMKGLHADLGRASPERA